MSGRVVAPEVASIGRKPPPVIVDLYHALKNQEVKRNLRASGNFHKTVATSAHSSIVGEIQNRSVHLLAVSVLVC